MCCSSFLKPRIPVGPKEAKFSSMGWSPQDLSPAQSYCPEPVLWQTELVITGKVTREMCPELGFETEKHEGTGKVDA